MSQIIKLQQLAIKSAKDQNWTEALRHNQDLLVLSPVDVSTLNRLGATYLQLNKPQKAQSVFQQVLKVDRSNKLATKHLERIKKKRHTALPSFSSESFIEEPGKTKSSELYRLAGKNILEKVSIGQKCELQPRNRYISIVINGDYVGSLPEDLSFRLAKLIKSGNEYSCHIRSCDGTHCTIHLREISRSKKNMGISSFPNQSNQVNSTVTINEVDESMLEEDIPVEIVHTDTDTEKTLDDIDAPLD